MTATRTRAMNATQHRDLLAGLVLTPLGAGMILAGLGVPGVIVFLLGLALIGGALS